MTYSNTKTLVVCGDVPSISDVRNVGDISFWSHKHEVVFQELPNHPVTFIYYYGYGDYRDYKFYNMLTAHKHKFNYEPKVYVNVKNVPHILQFNEIFHSPLNKHLINHI